MKTNCAKCGGFLNNEIDDYQINKETQTGGSPSCQCENKMKFKVVYNINGEEKTEKYDDGKIACDRVNEINKDRRKKVVVSNDGENVIFNLIKTKVMEALKILWIVIAFAVSFVIGVEIASRFKN